MMIIEGEADAFAMSLFENHIPSWQKGVKEFQEMEVWEKIKAVMHKAMPPEEYAKYMFGNKEMGIPENAGYYYAIRIINAYMEKHRGMTYDELLKKIPNEIYKESLYHV